MSPRLPLYLLSLILGPLLATAACTSNTTDTPGLQTLLQSGGSGYTLSLCSGQVYTLTGILNYTAVNQEISTENYPTDDTRATLLVGGFNITTAVQGQAQGLDGCKLRNIQINGNRGTSPIYQAPSANIEMGGANQNQLIEYVHTFDPRGWSCMHLQEGQFNCVNITVQNNDIGPCGTSLFQQWADGISLSCSHSLVQNNTIVDATDGGIVVFGAPFSTIRNNRISVQTRTMLGGINMVDVIPWQPEGNYSHTLVEGNTIHGGFATSYGNDTLGPNNASAIIKIGIAIGPRVWFNDQYGTNRSTGGIVQNNILSGAFAFGMGVGSAENFVIENNTFIGNVSFIANYGENCTGAYNTPNPPVPLLIETSYIDNVTYTAPMGPTPSSLTDGMYDFQWQNGTAFGLTCFLPMGSGDFAWPYGDGGVNSDTVTSGSTTPTTTTAMSTSTSTTGAGGSTTSSATPSGTSSGAGREVVLNLLGGRLRWGWAIGLGGLLLVMAL